MAQNEKLKLGFDCKTYEKGEIRDSKAYFKAVKLKRDAEQIMNSPKTIRKLALIEARAKLKGIYNEMAKAVEKNDFEKLMELVETNKRVEFPDKNEKSLLYMSCEKGNYEIVKFLIEKNAEINRKLLGLNKTCIMAAVQSGKLDIVRLLTEKGADVNARDKGKNNALALAAIWDFPVIFEYLLNSAGASPLVNGNIDAYLLELMQGKQNNAFDAILERWMIGNV